MNVAKNILKNIFSLSIAEMASKGLAFVYMIYLIRTIGPESNGVLNFAKSLVQYFLIAVALGFDQIGIRETAKDKSLLKQYVDLITSIRISIAIASFFLLFIIVQLLTISKPDLVNNQHIVYIYGITIFSNALMLNWVFQSLEKMEIIAFRTIGIYLLNFIGIFLFVKSSDDLTLAVIIISASMLINSIIMFVYYRQKYHTFNFNFDLKEWWRIIREALSIGLIFLIATLYNNIDITLLGIIKGDFETGIYGAAHQVIVFAILPSVILQGAFFPQITQRFTFEDRDRILSKFAKLQAFAGYLIFGYLFFLADYAVILLGEKYISSNYILQFLAFTVLIQFLISIYFAPLISWKAENKVIKANVIGLIINVVLNILLIPKYGMFGSAVATILCELGVLISMIVIFKKIHNKIYIKELLEFVPVLIFSFLPIYLFKEQINPIYGIIISSLLFFGISLAFKIIDIKEIKSLLKR